MAVALQRYETSDLSQAWVKKYHEAAPRIQLRGCKCEKGGKGAASILMSDCWQKVFEMQKLKQRDDIERVSFLAAQLASLYTGS